jgi:hypothetical protein
MNTENVEFINIDKDYNIILTYVQDIMSNINYDGIENIKSANGKFFVRYKMGGFSYINLVSTDHYLEFSRQWKLKIIRNI